MRWKNGRVLRKRKACAKDGGWDDSDGAPADRRRRMARMMHLKQGTQGEVIPRGKGGGRARGAWVWIAIVLMTMVVMTGCIGGEKKNENQGAIGTPIPQKTPEAAIFSVEKNAKEAPKTPITISMSIPSTLILNKVSDINITASSVLDAPNTKIELILPDGVSLVSDTTTWEMNLTANKPVTFSAKITMTKTGNWEIKVIAIRHRLSPPLISKSLPVHMRIKSLALVKFHDSFKNSLNTTITKNSSNVTSIM